ncbi:MAG: tRNA (N6-threonylcarbamoyladenosine(37)-N6)-methyltransferase TrmO [Desulfobacterales bacterium]|jgi:tRNA-Thr(GGU) m(6)t(6)A37 methyltransferase TsaA
MPITMTPIGVVHTDADQVPRHWTVSDVKGTLVIDKQYQKGLKDIKGGQQIVVIFHFHESPDFTPGLLVQQPPHRNEKRGVFSICSPKRPNPVGMSVLDVLRVEDNVIYVQGIDMLDGTPILDLKPFVKDKDSCPSYIEDQQS